MRMIAILSIFVMSCSECRIEPEKQARRVIIFQDISSSLENDAKDRAQVIVDTIIDGAPPETELVVIPLCANTSGAPAKRWTVEAPKGIGPKYLQEAAAKRKAFKLAAQEHIRTLRSTMATQGTCISSALRRADSEIRSLRSLGGSDVILVSDMIEECATPLFGTPANMRSRRFTAAATTPHQSQNALALPEHTRIFVIRPRAESTAVDLKDVPLDDEVRTFWIGLFDRCGVSTANIHWDVEVAHYVASL